MNRYTIAVFSFNTSSLCITETLQPDVKEENRKSRFSTWYDGIYPDFFIHVITILTGYSPDVIVFGNQEDRYPGSYLHSHFLPTYMPKYDYVLLKKSSLMGVGVTSYKNLLKSDLMTRGLSTSIYVKESLYPSMMEEEIDIRREVGGDGQTYYLHNKVTRGKGATAAYIKFPDREKIAIINSHLPFDSKTLIESILYEDPMIRQTDVNSSNVCYNSIIENLVIKQPYPPGHVIFFGDLNYRVSLRSKATTIAEALSSNPSIGYLKSLLRYDELRREMSKGNIYQMKEGVEDQGPIFLPTAKLVKRRKVISTTLKEDKEEVTIEEERVMISDRGSTKVRGDTYWNTGKYDQRIPSWCDRILYRDFNSKMKTECIYYDRFECGNCINHSDHAGVIGVFVI